MSLTSGNMTVAKHSEIVFLQNMKITAERRLFSTLYLLQELTMKTKKKGNNWTAFYDPDTRRYFAEIIYTSREGREQYNYEITADIYARLGTFNDDVDNERLIREAKMTYSFENTMYGTLGPERTVWDDEANEIMNRRGKKKSDKKVK